MDHSASQMNTALERQSEPGVDAARLAFDVDARDRDEDVAGEYGDQVRRERETDERPQPHRTQEREPERDFDEPDTRTIASRSGMASGRCWTNGSGVTRWATPATAIPAASATRLRARMVRLVRVSGHRTA